MDIQTIKDIQIDLEKLVEARNEKGLSKAEVANALGFDRRQIWQFEKGKGLTLHNFTKLALFYGKPIQYFVKSDA